MRRLLVVVLMTLLWAAAPICGRVEGAGRQGDPQYGARRNQSPDEAQQAREQARARNKDRQEKLKADTDKLLQLATELKEYVDKTNENILSIEVIKKTDEIEKLAKSVREKMKTYEMPPEQGFPTR